MNMVELDIKGTQALSWREIPDDGVVARILQDVISLRPFQYRLCLSSSGLKSGRRYCEWIPSTKDLAKLAMLLGTRTDEWYGTQIILKVDQGKKRKKIFLSSILIKANCKQCNSEVEFWYPNEYKCPKCGSNDFILRHRRPLKEIDEIIRKLS